MSGISFVMHHPTSCMHVSGVFGGVWVLSNCFPDIFECCRQSRSKTLLFSWIRSNGLCGSLKTFRLISLWALAIPTGQRSVLGRTTRKRSSTIQNLSRSLGQFGGGCWFQLSIIKLLLWVKIGFNWKVKVYRLVIQRWKQLKYPKIKSKGDIHITLNRPLHITSHKDTLDYGCGSDVLFSEYTRRAAVTWAGLHWSPRIVWLGLIAASQCLKFVVSGHLATTGTFQDSQGFSLTLHQYMDGEWWVVGEVMRTGPDALLSSAVNPIRPDDHDLLAGSKDQSSIFGVPTKLTAVIAF